MKEYLYPILYRDLSYTPKLYYVHSLGHGTCTEHRLITLYDHNIVNKVEHFTKTNRELYQDLCNSTLTIRCVHRVCAIENEFVTSLHSL